MGQSWWNHSLAWISDFATGQKALEYVKNEGGCTYGYRNDFMRQEWHNQKRFRVHHFHIFDWRYFPKVHASWVVLKTDPYLAVYERKFLHMEQAGLMELMSAQWRSFRGGGGRAGHWRICGSAEQFEKLHPCRPGASALKSVLKSADSGLFPVPSKMGNGLLNDSC